MLNIVGLKSRDMISIPLGIPDVDVLSVELSERDDYIVTVESTQVGTVCQHCGRKITKPNGHGRWIELRHLPILGHRVYIRLRPKRIFSIIWGKTGTLARISASILYSLKQEVETCLKTSI